MPLPCALCFSCFSSQSTRSPYPASRLLYGLFSLTRISLLPFLAWLVSSHFKDLHLNIPYSKRLPPPPPPPPHTHTHLHSPPLLLSWYSLILFFLSIMLIVLCNLFTHSLPAHLRHPLPPALAPSGQQLGHCSNRYSCGVKEVYTRYSGDWSQSWIYSC